MSQGGIDRMDVSGKPQTVSEMFPRKWLRADDLTKPVRVTIESVEVQTVRQRDGSDKLAPIVAFKGCYKRLIANRTQCHSIMDVVGSERFSDWPGHTVILSAGKAPNGKPTIAISAAQAQASE